jgi:hypothetical protein
MPRIRQQPDQDVGDGQGAACSVGEAVVEDGDTNVFESYAVRQTGVEVAGWQFGPLRPRSHRDDQPLNKARGADVSSRP